MKRQLIFTLCLVFTIAVGSLAGVAQAKDGAILQGEFAGLLADRLELVDNDVILTRAQKIAALEDLRFAPAEGYIAEERLTLKQLVVVLVRIYNFERDLPENYTHEDAVTLLIQKGILKEEDKLEIYVLYIRAVSIIANIEPIPGQKPGLVLLPRVPVGPPASPVD